MAIFLIAHIWTIRRPHLWPPSTHPDFHLFWLPLWLPPLAGPPYPLIGALAVTFPQVSQSPLLPPTLQPPHSSRTLQQLPVVISINLNPYCDLQVPKEWGLSILWPWIPPLPGAGLLVLQYAKHSITLASSCLSSLWLEVPPPGSCKVGLKGFWSTPV